VRKRRACHEAVRLALVERVEALLTRGTIAKPVVPPHEDDLEEMFDALAEDGAAPPAEAAPASVPVSPPVAEAPRAPAGLVAALSSADIDAIATAVVARLSDRVLREIAWDVVPDLAEVLVRERLRELERDERESG
jgi:hypothetical protein